MTHATLIPFPAGTASALLDQRPLADLTPPEFESFLYRSRMCPTRSRFMPGNAEWLVPRRDITVRVALETVRERMQQAVACAELVARLERDYLDEDTQSDDDEALVVAAAVRDNLREALGMLGVVEAGLQRMSREVRDERAPETGSAQDVVEEARGRYEVLALAA